jgi:hypothetical protein
MRPPAVAEDPDDVDVDVSDRVLLQAVTPVSTTATVRAARSFFFDNSVFLPR